MRFDDNVKLISARWKNNKKSVALVILNISAAILMLLFFFNMGLNIEGFLEEKILTHEYFQHVIFTPQKGSVSINDEFLYDERVEKLRIIYDVGIPVSFNEVSMPSYVTLAIVEADEFIFDGENRSDAPFDSYADDYKSGIIVSSSVLYLMGENGEDIIGKNVSFTYMGKEYVLPVSAVLSSTAEQNLNFSYASPMYVFAENITDLPTELIAADVRLSTMQDVPDYIRDYDDDNVFIYSYIDEVEHNLKLITVITVIFISAGIAFLLFSSVGIINSLQLLSEKNSKNICLLKTVGFDSSALTKLNLLESFFMASLSFAAASAVYIIILNFMKNADLFTFGMLTPQILFKNNYGVIGICALLSFLLIICCNLFVNTAIDNKNLVENLKQE